MATRPMTAKYGLLRKMSVLVLMLIPLIALLGWTLDVPTLRTIIPGLTPMNPLTAVCFIVIALVMWFLLTHQDPDKATPLQRTILYLAGIALVLVGSAIMLRSLFGWPLSPDTILFSDRLDTNRMAPNTALNFWLLGIALICMTSVTLIKYGFVRVSAMIVFSVSLSAILGYGLNLLPLYSLGTLTPMALHTATLFLVISGGILTVRFERNDLNRKVLLGLVIMLTAILSVVSLVVASFGDQHNLQAKITKAEEITATSATLLSTMKDAETGQRGYLLTGNKTYLEPYNAAVGSYKDLLSKLRTATKDEADQAPRIAELEAFIQKKFDVINLTIALYSQQSPAASIAVVKTNRGKIAMDDIRRVTDDISHDVRTDISATVARQHRTDIRTLQYIQLTSALAVLLIISVMLLLVRETGRRTKAEQELREEKNFAIAAKTKDEAILSSIGDGVFALDRDNRIILFNKAAERISGFSEQEAIGKPYTDILMFSSEDGKTTHAKFIEEAQYGKLTQMEQHTVLKNKAGDLIPVDDSAAPIHDADGVQIGIIIVFRDITKQRQLDRAKDEFISLVSHQLRTPLTAIRLFIEMLNTEQVGKLNAQQKDYTEKVQLSTERMIKLVGDILNVSRIELGRIKVEPVQTDVNTLIAAHIGEIDLLAKEKGVHVAFTPQKDMPKVAIDPTLYGQIIHNLLTNAVRYTRDNEGKIVVAFMQKGKDFELSVQDNGIGIPEVEQPHIFERFYRADNAKKAVGDGTGLGLYLIKLIVTTAGGTVRFESVQGKGTTFYVTVPANGMKPKQGDRGLS